MCTVTLSYDKDNAKAQQALLALLSTGLFQELEHGTEVDEDILDDVIDYSDPWLFEDHDNQPPLPEGKDSFTPEELYDLILKDIRQIYEFDEV